MPKHGSGLMRVRMCQSTGEMCVSKSGRSLDRGGDVPENREQFDSWKGVCLSRVGLRLSTTWIRLSRVGIRLNRPDSDADGRSCLSM